MNQDEGSELQSKKLQNYQYLKTSSFYMYMYEESLKTHNGHISQFAWYTIIRLVISTLSTLSTLSSYHHALINCFPLIPPLIWKFQIGCI